MRRMSVLAVMVTAVVLGLTGLTGTGLAATSQSGATGGGKQPNEGPNGGVCTVSACHNDPDWEFGGFDGNYPFDGNGCSAIGEPTGVKAPVELEYKAWGEAEFEVAPGCLSAVWLHITGPEGVEIPGEGPKSLVVHMFRLYSIRPAETSGATHYWGETGHAWSTMLDGREGCIVAFVGVMPAQGQGLSPDGLTELEWGSCVPPGTASLLKEKPAPEMPPATTPITVIERYETIRTEVIEAKAAVVPAQLEARGGIGTAFHESRRPTKPKAKSCRKHGKKVACKKPKKVRKTRPNGRINGSN